MSPSFWLLCLLLVVMFGQILLVAGEADPSPENKTIHIGYLLQTMDRAGAINVAVAQAKTDGLLRDYNFRYDCRQNVASFAVKYYAFSDDVVLLKTG